MDAHKALITNIFNNSTLVEVPFFQRSYVWREDLWGRLLEDMEFVVKTKKPHFLGSIILKEGRKPRQGENFADCRTIVDGQQRLTTFLIFMKVLCLKLGQTALFDCQFRIMGQMIALRHGRNGILESYIMRRVVVHASTKSYNNLFTSLILNKVLDSQTLTLRLKGIGDATTYCPDDNEMKIGFETSKLVNLQSKGIIYLLESKIRSDNSSTALLGFNNYSLEHLMPKKWRNNWGACATEDDAKKRDSLLLTLGNLAIIPQALNASIRDAAWNVKKAGKGQNKPGLLLCASGLYTLHDVLQKNDWNEHEIENRAEWLLANAQNIWKI